MASSPPRSTLSSRGGTNAAPTSTNGCPTSPRCPATIADDEQIAAAARRRALISTTVSWRRRRRPAGPRNADPHDQAGVRDALATDGRDLWTPPTLTGLHRRRGPVVAPGGAVDPEPFDVAGDPAAILAFAGTLRRTPALLADVTSRLARAGAAGRERRPPSRPDDRTVVAHHRDPPSSRALFVLLPEFSLARPRRRMAARLRRAGCAAHVSPSGPTAPPLPGRRLALRRCPGARQGPSRRVRGDPRRSLGAGRAGASRRCSSRAARATPGWRCSSPSCGRDRRAVPIDQDKLLYTAHFGRHRSSSSPASPYCGVLLDEWTEVIPGDRRDNRHHVPLRPAEHEPPQTLLLAPPPDFTGRWSWDDLVDSLHETLDLARKRAVEPRHVDRPRTRASSRRRCRRSPATRSSRRSTWPSTTTVQFAVEG